MVELLSPAGSGECFYAAINNGANAVYLGLDEFSARRNADNFTIDTLGDYLAYARLFGVKVYVAVNTLIKNDELDKYFSIIEKAYLLGVDAFIIQDIAFGKILKAKFPDIELHLSTQAGVNNAYGAQFAVENCFKRVVLARETDIEQIKNISKLCEAEVFIHGAMCTCFSGQCYMSSFVGGNSGNRGACKQPCRQKYTYAGENFTCEESYSLSLADLRLKDKINDLIKAGVTSFKIEGRMRSPEYVATATRAYRNIIDGCESANDFDDLSKIYNRGNYTTGYTFGLDKNIISDKIQNHMGKYVCTVEKFSKDEIFTKPFNIGDSFKIVRNGKEVGNAVYSKKNGRGAMLYSGDIKKGDSLYITKDIETIKRALSYKKKIPLDVTCDIRIDQPIILRANGIEVKSHYIVQPASSSATGFNEIKNNLLKTDIYPFEVNTNISLDNGVFVLKSALNKVRSALYKEVYDSLSKNIKSCKISDNSIDYKGFYDLKLRNNKDELSVISSDLEYLKFTQKNIDNVIFFPFDYNGEEEFLKFEKDTKDINVKKFLYLPPYFTEEDESVVSNKFKYFDGIYSDGYYALKLYEKYKMPLFAGTGFNIFNDIDVSFLSSKCDKYVYSKELSNREIGSLKGEGGVFSLGNITLMDLIYCPFKKTCATCNRGNIYSLTDSSGRKFTVRRYKMSSCRFKLYNCSDLVCENDAKHKIYNFVLYDTQKILSLLSADLGEAKKIIENHTVGNSARGIK